jgi:preprotein translocase subunit YajC
MLNTLINWAFGVSTALADAATTGGAATTDAAAAPTLGAPDLLSTLIPMALIFVVFYFLLIRPQRKKDKKVKQMLAELKVTDRVCTIGGIYGTIVTIKDDTITLSVGQDNVKLVFARWAIRNVEEATVENDSEVLA